MTLSLAIVKDSPSKNRCSSILTRVTPSAKPIRTGYSRDWEGTDRSNSSDLFNL